MSIIQGFIGAVSNTNNVRYTIVPDYTYIDEGGTASAQTVTYTITTTGVDDGTTLYWNNGGTTVAADIGGAADGISLVIGGTATISLTATADTTTEGTETIIIRLYTDSGFTHLVATAATVTVGDTSLSPPVPGSGVFVATSNTSLKLGETYWTINSEAVLGNVNAGTSITLRDPSLNQYNTTLHDYANGSSFNVNKVNNMPQPGSGWYWSIDGGAYWWPINSSSEPTLPNTPWNLGTTWTIEFWMKANGVSSAQQGLVCQDGWFGNLLGGNRNNAILVALVGGDLSVGLTNGYDNNYYTEPAPGSWTHVAVVNTAGTIKTFYNGSEQTKSGSSGSGSASYTNNYMPLYIGRLGGGYGGLFDGKITNVRITNTAVYTSDFTPALRPTRINGNTKLLWTPTDQVLAVDSGDYATAITNNGITYSSDYPVQYAQTSAVFANTPKYLTVTGGSQLNLGLTWTIEWWQKADSASTGSLRTILCQDPSDLNQGKIDIFCQNGNLLVGNGQGTVGPEPTPGVWTHIALSSYNGAVIAYYNGVQQYAAQLNYALTSTSDLCIGRRGPSVNGQNFVGKITNIHIINNADKYTGAFVPAVLPLRVAGTKLLWTPSNYSVILDRSTYKATITNTGSVASNTDYPNEFAYEDLQDFGGVLTMTKSINGLSVQAGATNFNGSPTVGSYISIDSVTVASDYSIGIGQSMTRGHTMVVINKETNAIVSINTYDTWDAPSSIEAPLAAVTAGRIVILVSYDATACTSTMRSTLVNSYGATASDVWTPYRKSHLFIGVKR